MSCVALAHLYVFVQVVGIVFGRVRGEGVMICNTVQVMVKDAEMSHCNMNLVFVSGPHNCITHSKQFGGV